MAGGAMIFTLLAFFSSAAASDCRREFVPYLHTGIYHRVHPSGKAVLYTGGEAESAVIVDWSGGKPQAIRTALAAEVFPVEARGEWTILSSAGKKSGMEYYWYEDIRRLGKRARPFFVDPDHGGLYHSAAELPGSTPERQQIRAYSFLTRKIKDYTIERSAGKTRVIAGEEREVCPNLRPQETPRTRELQAKIATLFRRHKQRRDVNKSELEPLVEELERLRFGPKHAELKKRIAALRAAGADAGDLENELTDLEGAPIAQPVLSKDGQYLAGSNGRGRIYVYRLEEGGCTVVAKTRFPGEKVSFSAPSRGTKIVFTADGVSSGRPGKKIVVFDFQAGDSTVYAPPEGEDAYYPGFTIDGRIVYSTGKGFVTIAPACVHGAK